MKLRDVPEINLLELVVVVYRNGNFRDSEPGFYLERGKDDRGEFINVARGIRRGREYGVQRVYLSKVEEIKRVVELES